MTRCRFALAVALIAAGLPLAACGDDDDDGGGSGSEPAKVSMELTPKGKKAAVSAPKTVDAGVVTVTMKNSSKKDAGLQFVRVVGDHSPAEVIKAGNAWGQDGKAALPKWIELKGGVPSARPGQSRTSTQSLEPGKYLALELDSNEYAAFDVTGDGSGQPETPAATIDATEYQFKATGLKAGKSEVEFANKGGQPHIVVGLPLTPGKTVADAQKFFKSNGKGGPPPFNEKDKASFDTPVSDGGGKQVVSLDLKKGNYVLICFVPDRQGGPPHVAKGMISAATVK